MGVMQSSTKYKLSFWFSCLHETIPPIVRPVKKFNKAYMQSIKIDAAEPEISSKDFKNLALAPSVMRTDSRQISWRFQCVILGPIPVSKGLSSKPPKT